MADCSFEVESPFAPDDWAAPRRWTLEKRYATALGVKPEESALQNFLRQALQYPAPHPWTPKVDPKARVFYANTESSESAWEHPLQPSRRDSCAQVLRSILDHLRSSDSPCTAVGRACVAKYGASLLHAESSPFFPAVHRQFRQLISVFRSVTDVSAEKRREKAPTHARARPWQTSYSKALL